MSGADLVRAVGMVVAIGGLEHDVGASVMDGDPYSKSRPRFSRNGKTYVKKADRLAEDRTGWWLRTQRATPMTGNVALACIFYRSNRQRIDVDNMLKHVCDAANGILWTDDSQCTALLGVAELDEHNPRTVIAFAPHVSTLTRGSDAIRECLRCGKPFNIVGIYKHKKYCTTECASLGRSGSWLAEPVACAQCGQKFRRTTKTQKLCSPECRADAIRGRNKARSVPLSRCAECGKQLTHHRGGRCRECWRANPHPPLGGALS